MAAHEFTTEEDDILINEISKRPEIFDPRNPEYNKHSIKEQQWVEISKKLNKSIDLLKKRWKNHRDNYFKQKKSKRKRSRNILGQKLSFLSSVEPRKFVAPLDAPPRKRPRLRAPPDDDKIPVDPSNQQETLMDTDEEEFQPLVQEVRSLQEPQPMSETSTNEEETLKDRDILELLTGLLKRRDQENGTLVNHILSLQNQRKNEDELDLFFKCISQTMRKLTPNVICELKTKIFSLVSQQELKMLQPLQELKRPDSSMSTTSDANH